MSLSPLWTLQINNATPVPIGSLCSAATVSYVNQRPDTLTLTEVVGDTTPTPDSAFAWDDIVTLRRDGVVWLRGRVRRVGLAVDQARTIEILGAWNDLERRAYLQSFTAATDPTNPASGTTTVKRGRIVLGQADNGLKVQLGPFLASVLTYAGFIPDVAGLDFLVPWDEATDLSCADVIERMLRWAPNAVVWWDYSTTPATGRIRPRASLTPVTLDLAEGVIESVRLEPRPDLRAERVALFYIATHRLNESQWETVTSDVWPEGTTGEEPGCLVRTIELAGAVVNFNQLKQRVRVRQIPAALTDATLTPGPVTSGSVAAALLAWWRRKYPILGASGVEVLGWRNGTRVRAEDGGAVNEDLGNELIEGGITEWMTEEGVGVVAELQEVGVDVVYNLPDPEDPARKQTVKERLRTRIAATNATTRTYTQLENQSITPAEPVPVGLAQALHAALEQLQWDGEIELVEAEATARPGPGALVNLAGDRAEWTSMAALVQRRTVDIGEGRTTIVVGPARQLGPDDLVEVYRHNRTRRPVTSAWSRTTGKTSGGGAGALSTQPPVVEVAVTRCAPKVMSSALTVAGVVPTSDELVTAVQAAYPSGEFPVLGDVVELTVGGVVKFRARVGKQGETGSLFSLSFTVNGASYRAQVEQVGLFYY